MCHALRCWYIAQPMAEEKREEEVAHPNNSSSTTMPFSDEIPNNNNLMMTFPFQVPPTIFDVMMMPSSSSSFIDLLGVQDYNAPLFDCLPGGGYRPAPSPASSNVPDSSEVLNTPAASPNLSSISSSSNEATVNNNSEQQSGKELQEEEGGNGGRGDNQDQDKTKKQWVLSKENDKYTVFFFKKNLDVVHYMHSSIRIKVLHILLLKMKLQF